MSNTADAILAMKKANPANNWGVVTSANLAGARILADSIPSGIKMNPEIIEDNVIGSPFPLQLIAGERTVDVESNQKLRWVGTELIWLANFMGSATNVDQTPPAGVQFSHTLDLIAEQPANSYFTVAMTDGVTSREIRTLKPSGFTLSGNASEFFTLTLNGIGDRVDVPALTNTTLAAATHVNFDTLIPYGGLRARINRVIDPGTGLETPALSATEVICPTSISVSANRDLGDGFCATNATVDGVSEWITDEPTQLTVPRDIEVTMEFNEYTDALFLQSCQNGDELKMDWLLNGKQYDTTNSLAYRLNASFPKLIITDLETPGDAGEKITQTLTMRATFADTAPNGIPNTSPVRFVFTNNETINYLTGA